MFDVSLANMSGEYQPIPDRASTRYSSHCMHHLSANLPFSNFLRMTPYGRKRTDAPHNLMSALEHIKGPEEGFHTI